MISFIYTILTNYALALGLGCIQQDHLAQIKKNQLIGQVLFSYLRWTQ